jgi:hypothetical protein
MGDPMPQHRFASHGRRDVANNDRHQPMTVAPMQPSGQPPQPKTVAEQLLDAVHRVPQRQREHIAAVVAQNLNPDETLKKIANSMTRRWPLSAMLSTSSARSMSPITGP